LIELEERIALFGDIKTQRDQIQSDFDTLSADQKKTLAELGTLREEFSSLRDQDHKEHQRLIEQHEHDNQIAAELRETLADRENKIHELTTKNTDQLRQLTSLQSVLTAKEDVAVKVDLALDLAEQLKEMNINLQQSLEKATNTIVEQEEKLLRANLQINDLKKELDEKTEQLITLREQLRMYTGVTHYTGFKGDDIDIKLAEFINAHPDGTRLTRLFNRENYGVYTFGSKRITIKLEQEKLIVRVGGGYLVIHEFTELYTPIEFEKFQRKSSEKNVVVKGMISKTTSGRNLLGSP